MGTIEEDSHLKWIVIIIVACFIVRVTV